MASEIILHPVSMVPVTSGRVFPNIYVGGGSGSKHDFGLGFQASLGADSIWRLRYIVPPALPSGTGKFTAWCLASATSGNAKLNVKWASVALTEDPSSATLQAEGVSTLTWAAGEADKYKELLVTLDADTLVASEMVVMDLTGETSGWTLAATLTLAAPRIIWV